MTDERDQAVAGMAVAAQRLDRSFLRLRRVMVVPATTTLPIPSIGRPVDLAKVMACMAISDDSHAAAAAGAGPTVKDVAIALDIEHSTASRLLTDAEAEGLVRRHQDPVDRRRTTLELTEVGRLVVADSGALRASVISQVFAEWDTHDVEQLVNLLERMIDTLNARMPDAIRHVQNACQLAAGQSETPQPECPATPALLAREP